jgi:type II secretory pathway pseudopilin PulG
MKRVPSQQRGFALAALIIFMTALTIALAAAMPVYRLQVQRELEEELIFRGDEYVRAIQKYQRQFGIFPPSVDALLDTNGIPYLRRAYADPITGEAFRLLTVNPDGTINGSTLLSSANAVQGLFQTAVPQFFGGSGSGPQNARAAQAPGSSGGAGLGFPQATRPNFQASPVDQRGGAVGLPAGVGQAIFPGAQGRPTPDSFLPPGGRGDGVQSQTPPFGPTGDREPRSQPGTVAGAAPLGAFGGGGIVGVAPANEDRSLKTYNSREVYREWEFIALPGFGTLPFGQTPGQPPTFDGDASDPFSNTQPNPFN